MPRLPTLLLALALAGCGAPDLGPGAGPDDPIVAGAEAWTWVGFPGSTCGNGQPTGIGVNLTARSTDVVIYFQGGGACWDAATCLGYQTAANLLSGYGAADFAAEPLRGAAAFDRSDPASPFRAASLVFVPYCTGDLHAGDAVRTYAWAGATTAVRHTGARNTGLFLRRLSATFPGARRIFVAGSSAGGYAAQLNYPRLAAAFPAAEVHALADGAQLVQPAGTLYADWQAAWGLSPPAGCAGCATELPALARWLADGWPTRRFGLLASTQDSTLSLFFGLTSTQLDAATRGLLASGYDATANGRYFALPGTQHTMLGDLSTQGAGGLPLSAWLAGWYDGDAAWASAGP